jgi:hypothetical protein
VHRSGSRINIAIVDADPVDHGEVAADAMRGEAERVAREADGPSQQVVTFVGEIAAA